MKVAELRELSVEELKNTLAEARKELLGLRFRHATGQLAKTAGLPAARHDIARILTILKEKGA